MKSYLIIHIFEIILALIYIMYIWPVYEGEDYLWGIMVCIGYILSLVIYCIITSLLPAMQIACGVTDTTYSHRKKILYYTIQWCAFTIFIVLAFNNSLNYYACIPIIIPNCVFLLYLFFGNIYKSRR